MGGAVLPLALAAQPISLARPDAEFKEAFAQIGTVRELADGRVVVVDPRDRTVQLIDFRSGAATRIGRLGQGPGEYGFPARIIALPADTSAIYDPPNARYLLITPQGLTGATFRLDEKVAVHLGGRGSVPRGTDARGRVFFEGSPIAGGRGEATTAVDSAPVMRYDRQTKKLDTLAYVQLQKGNVRISRGAGGGMSIRV